MSIDSLLGLLEDVRRDGTQWFARCPAHEEKEGSLHIGEGDDGRILLHCFAGCAYGDILASLGVKRIDTRPATSDQAGRAKRYTPPPKQRQSLKGFGRGNYMLWDRVARDRGLRRMGIEYAVKRGWMRFGTHREYLCWLLTDSTGRNAQARHIDDTLFLVNGKERKADTLCGFEASWPIGAVDIGSKPQVALVEGGPDFLAACQLILDEKREDVAPVCITGSSMRIPEDALPLFRTKEVRIYADNDEPGQKAADRWASQLSGVACDVDILVLDEFGVKDLNDYVQLQLREEVLP